MIAYLDSSVLLRLVLGETGRLREWQSIEAGVSSELALVECLRVLDHLRLRGGLSDRELAVRRAAVLRLLEALELVEVGRSVVARASEPFPTPLGTPNAIHLATALLCRQWRERALVFATHDEALALAARASGLEVVGA